MIHSIYALIPICPEALEALGPDLVLFVGDFGNGEAARFLERLGKFRWAHGKVQSVC